MEELNPQEELFTTNLKGYTFCLDKEDNCMEVCEIEELKNNKNLVPWAGTREALVELIDIGLRKEEDPKMIAIYEALKGSMVGVFCYDEDQENGIHGKYRRFSKQDGGDFLVSDLMIKKKGN